jgi:xanthine dehydrogenase accessory factor
MGLLGPGKVVKRSVNILDGQTHLLISSKPAELELTETTLSNTFGPGIRLLIIGAGQIE